MTKISFLIYIPGRKENIGGQVVLHKLVKILADMGEEVWTNQIPMFECNSNILEQNEDGTWNTKNVNNTIVALYPEQIEGNPFNVENVTRWILYHTKESVEKTWSTSDIHFYYIEGFKSSSKTRYKLTTLDSKLDIFSNKGLGSKKKGYCHINKKKYPVGEKTLSHLESKDLSNFMECGGFKYLAEEFNKHEYFVTYDDATYYSILAALCGCRSIIINTNPLITPDEYREMYHISKYGISYGWNDIKHADLTRDLLRDFIKSIEKESIKNVTSFIDFWVNKVDNIDINKK